MKNRSPSFPKKVIESNRERWIVYYFDTEKQKRWSRRFTSEQEAQEFFRTKNIYDEKLGVEANRISPIDKRDLVEAKILLKPLKVSISNAVLTYAKLTKGLAEHGVSLTQAIEEYKSLVKLKERSVKLDFAIDGYYYSLLKKELTSDYIYTVERILTRFMESIGKDKIVSLISAKEIYQWLINLKKREYAESDTLTVGGRPMKVFQDGQNDIGIHGRNEYRRTLYSFFKYCKMQDWLDINPVEKVESWRIRGKTPEIFTPEEVQKILNSTPQQSEIRAYAAIAAFTGIRNAEMKRLTWDKIKLDDREIILDSEITKTASRRVVKIPENLAKWLDPYVWELGTKKKVLSKSQNLQIKKIHNALGKGNWVKNGFRHSAATYYLALTKNAYLTAEQMGHAVDVLKQHYQRPCPRKGRHQVFQHYAGKLKMRRLFQIPHTFNMCGVLRICRFVG